MLRWIVTKLQIIAAVFFCWLRGTCSRFRNGYLHEACDQNMPWSKFSPSLKVRQCDQQMLLHLLLKISVVFQLPRIFVSIYQFHLKKTQCNCITDCCRSCMGKEAVCNISTTETNPSPATKDLYVDLPWNRSEIDVYVRHWHRLLKQNWLAVIKKFHRK